MSISRRSFVRSIGLGSAGALAWPIVAARGSEALAGGLPAPLDLVPDTIRLDSNENPRGPSSEAMDAIRATLGEGGRYPRDPTAQLHAALATSFGVHGGNIVLGCGSTEILRSAVFAFTSPTRHVVIAAPTFETPGSTAEMLGLPVRSIPVDRALRLDLDAMLDAAPGAGLVYLCNPNNPTGTVHGAAAVRDFVARVRQVSPRTVILIDEAYHEYVDDPEYATAMSIALEGPGVLVARTFSKVFGLAGLRVGYAVGHPETIAALGRWRLQNGLNALGVAAALASLPSLPSMHEHIARERVLNREARAFTTGALQRLGATVVPSQANFLLADIGRDAKEFQAACKARGVLVGRPFPPLTTYSRISLGTLAEMRRACDALGDVLRPT